MRVAKALAVLIAVVALLDCNPVAEKGEAEAVAARIFAAREVGHAEQALVLYDEAFYRETPRDEWSGMLAAMEARLGRPTSHELAGWNVSLATNAIGTGTFVTLNYRVRYERGEGTESLVLFKPEGQSAFHAVGHQIQSPLLQEPQPGAPERGEARPAAL